MMATTKQFFRELKKRKSSVFIGVAVGGVAAYYAISQGLVDLASIVAAGEGLLDDVLGREALPTTLAEYKLYGTFMFMGGGVGFLIDILLERLGLIRRR